MEQILETVTTDKAVTISLPLLVDCFSNLQTKSLSHEATHTFNFSLSKQETSLHGLKYVTNSRTMQEKSAWVVLLLAAFIAASVFVYMEGERLQEV